MGLEISERVARFSERAMEDIAESFSGIEKTAQENTKKVLEAFIEQRVSDGCFAGTTGYGYNDKGRETLDSLYARVFGSEAALVRTSFVNGTHAITAALFAALSRRPRGTLLSATGEPYDTLRAVIGITGDYRGSLRDYGADYAQVELNAGGKPDFKAIGDAVREKRPAAVFIQRSRGYSSRPALTVQEIGEICELAHGIDPGIAVVVDNCYGEFCETEEPAGADLIAGSLIKNPGGGLTAMGGYVAGSAELVAAAAYRLTAPGIGAECGALPGGYRLLYQGLFTAPHTVAQALKTAVFCSRLFELLGYKTSPASGDRRCDIIQSVELGSPELLLKFCKGLQAASPVDSYVTPEPWDMPGYDCPVIMAAGAFVQGASIELSADGPMRIPYTAYVQGGLTFEAGKLGIMHAASYLDK